ncbi:MAG: hypothetical protein JST39_05975, partial [Bacteroidetes bacterium]|nr:hypothetical protein [Bacteroidota bacterium]
FGVFYSFLYRRAYNEVWAWILTTPFFLLVNIYGADTKKALGGILIYFLTVALLRKILMKRIDPFIRTRGPENAGGKVPVSVKGAGSI